MLPIGCFIWASEKLSDKCSPLNGPILWRRKLKLKDLLRVAELGCVQDRIAVQLFQTPWPALSPLGSEVVLDGEGLRTGSNLDWEPV